MLKKSIILAAIALLVALAFFLRHHEAPPNTVSPVPSGMFHATDTQWASLTLVPVEQKIFHTTVKTDGKIAGNDDTTTPVFSPYSGRVTKLFAKAGDHVERGDPLMAIAAPDFVNARAQLKLAITNEKRQHELYKAKTGALKDWQQAQADLETAKGNFHMAGVAAAKTKTANDEGADVVVAAPISGTVIQRQVGVGQYINSAAGGAANPVFSIGDLSTVWLLANVREADAPLMRVGEPVEMRVLAYPDRIFKAKLTYVAPSIDPATHRLSVRAEIENADGALKPEMFASFDIITDADVTTVGIPEDAVIYEGENAHVWVAQPNDKLIGLRPIHVGRSGDGHIEVVDGIKPGEIVVTSGSLFIDRAAKMDDTP